MAGMFDIGSSGIQAYRKALTVTGQNIANLNTEGYRRREASLEEVSASQGDIMSISDQAGLGVRVSDISRAFDSFIAGRARDSNSDFSRADAYSGALETLETVLLPEDYDLTFSINEFFNGMSSIAQAPGDLAARVVALEQGRSLASGFSALASSIEQFQNAIVSEVKNTVSALNTELQGLADIQAKLISAGGSGKASNALLDQRDKSIGSISELAGVSVDYNVRGDVKLTLGSTGSGPVLIDSKDAGLMTVLVQDSQINVYSGAGGGSQAQTQQLSSGALAGLVSAYETVSQSARDLDALARKVTLDLNKVHAGGLSLDGEAGSDLYSLDSYGIVQSATNLGSITAQVIPTGTLPETDISIEITYDKAAGLWRGRDAEGAVVASGASGFEYQGLSVRISGAPADGDVLSMSLSRGKAANMRFLLERPQEFAAAGAVLATQGLDNTGTAAVSVVDFAADVPSGLPDVTKMIANDGGVAGAVRLRADGVVGVIPAGVGAIDLFSLKRQDTASFVLADAQQDDLTSITLTLAGATHSFNVSSFSVRRGTESDIDMSDLAEMLNSGSLVSADGRSIADLGIFAAGQSGALSLASANTAFEGARLEANGTVTAEIAQRNDAVSNIQVFTREGRQIAGTPLGDADVLKYLTAKNGFLESAEYRADYLNGTAAGGYQGASIVRSAPTGSHTMRVSTAGFSPAVWTGTALPLSVPTAAQTISLTVGSDPATTIDIPQGVMASYVADQINAVRGDHGVFANAQTRVRLSGAPDGALSFTLMGDNDVPAKFEAQITDGDLSDIAALINASTHNTGIAAHLAGDLSQMVLVNDAGADIVIGDVETAGAGISAIPVGSDGGVRIDTAAVLGSQSGDHAFARFGGEVTLSAQTSFSVTTLAGAKASVADPFADGKISRQVDPAGTWQQLGFHAVEGIDGNEARPDGTLASAAAAQFSISLETDGSLERLVGSVSSADLADLSSGSIAAGLAKTLRSGAPVPVLRGAPTAVPQDGAAISISLGNQDYTLWMQGGEVTVTGPEAGRLTASFDADSGLVISAHDGAETGEQLRVATGASPASMALFGLLNDDRSQVLTGRAIDPAAITQTVTTLGLEIGDDRYDVGISRDENDAIIIASSPTLPSGVTVDVVADAGGALQVAITAAAGATDVQMRVLPSAEGRELGFGVTPNQILVNTDGLRLTTADKTAVDVSGSASSLISEHLSLSGLPDEELIVIVTGDGARRLSARFQEDAITEPTGLNRALEIVVADGASGRVEIIDQQSGHSIASRYLDQTGRISVAGMDLIVNGSVETGDRFSVAPNANGQGDGRNISKILALQSLDTVTGRGGFTEKFSALITDVGAKVRAGTIATAAAEATRDAAAEMESEFSGVNLDTEAARLLEQQQAYQALARVLSTAKELLDTLMNSI